MDELAKRFSELAQQYAPNVVEAALQATRVEAHSTLVGSFMWFGWAMLCLFIGRYCWRKNVCDDLDMPFGRIGAGILFCVAAGFFAIAIWSWVDPWTWVALNHPELWIAKKALRI
jgi:hypothetical protein